MTTQLQFTKPFILVTRIGSNDTNNQYHNPRQRYYEFDNMRVLFYRASKMNGDETPVSALRILVEAETLADIDNSGVMCRQPRRADYFHNFTKALEEYKQGVRV